MTAPVADRGILIAQAHAIVQGREVKLHLPHVLGQEVADFQFQRDQALQSPMVQQQVKEVLPVVDLQAVLAPHECKHATHGAEEDLDLSNQRPLQFPFGVLLAEFQEIERIFVLHCQFGLIPNTGGHGTIEVGLAEQRLLVGLVLNLVRQHVLGPPELAGHANVELALQWILALLQNHEIVRPTYFSHQWCEFCRIRVCGEEKPHTPEVRC